MSGGFLARGVFVRGVFVLIPEKMHLALDLLEKEYKNHFDFIVIICPMLKHNETYRSRNWIWTDPYITSTEPGNHLHDWIEKVSKQFADFKTLFLIDDIIADEDLGKKDSPCWN